MSFYFTRNNLNLPISNLDFRGDQTSLRGSIPFPLNYDPLMPLPRGIIPTLPAPTNDYPVGRIPSLFPAPIINNYPAEPNDLVPSLFPSIVNTLPIPAGSTRTVKATLSATGVPDYVKTAPAEYVPPLINPIFSLNTTETTNVSHDLVTTVGAPAIDLQPQSVSPEETVTSADSSPLQAITNRFTTTTVQADGTVKTKVDPALLLMAGGIFVGLILLKAKS